MIKDIFVILRYGNEDMSRSKLLRDYFYYWIGFRKIGISKEEILESGVMKKFIQFPHQIRHCVWDQLLEFFNDNIVRRLIVEGRLEDWLVEDINKNRRWGR